MDEPILWVILLAAAALAVTALLGEGRVRLLAMGGALVLCPILIAADNWDTERFRSLRDSPEVIAAVIVLGGAALAGLAALLARRAPLFPLLAIAALPFRIPIEAGGESANLLIPLYAVIAAGVLAAWIGAWRNASTAASGFRADLLGGWRGRCLLVLAAFVALYVVQASYSDDFSKAAENACFFFIPFTVLLGLLERVEWDRRLMGLAGLVVLGEAALFGLVGVGELIAGDLLWNEEVQASNEIHTYFRVNSLFWDPNIFGRYIAITAIAVVAATLWARARREALAGGAIALLLIVMLLSSFSQSSFVALLAGLVVLGALRWSVRWAAIGSALAIAALVAVVLVNGSAVDFDISDKRSLRLETSGRSELIRGGLELAADRPVAGWGSGSFEHEFGSRFATGTEAAATASHTEPITILAEQGVIGLLIYGALIVGSLAALTSGLRAWCPGFRGGGWAAGEVAGAAARAGLAASFIAMLVHSLSYAAFLTDPITWALLGIGLPLAARRPETLPETRTT